jgi:hypothetical protein
MTAAPHQLGLVNNSNAYPVSLAGLCSMELLRKFQEMSSCTMMSVGQMETSKTYPTSFMESIGTRNGPFIPMSLRCLLLQAACCCWLLEAASCLLLLVPCCC